MRRFLSVVVVMFCSVVVWGQTNRGGISGTVTDQNGAVVPGATVTITNLATNQTQTMTTSESGGFAFNLLEPVDYSVQVEMKGFKKMLLPKVKVDTAMTTTANVALETGTLDQTVTVTSGTAFDQFRIPRRSVRP